MATDRRHGFAGLFGRCVGRVDPPAPTPPVEVVCAWCFPGVDAPGMSHGICDRHMAELLGTPAPAPERG